METSKRPPRVRKRVAVQYGPTRSLGCEGQVQNVSSDGAAVKGTATFPVGTVLRLMMRPAGQKPLAFEGRVAWTNGAAGLMGLQLSMKDPRYEAFIAEPPSPDAPTPTADLPRFSGSAAAHPTPPASPASPAPVAPSASGSHASLAEPITTPRLISGSHPRIVRPDPTREVTTPDFRISRGVGVPGASTHGRTSEVPPVPATSADLACDSSHRPRLPRFDVELIAKITFPPERECLGIITNMSHSGLSLICRGEIHRGTRVSVALTTEDGTQVRVGGTVARAQRANTACEVGVKVTLSDDAWSGLVNEMSRRKPSK
jgi:hypothetical protein